MHSFESLSSRTVSHVVKPGPAATHHIKMIDASSTKEGFRVFRTRAHTLLFKLANGSHTMVDDNKSACYCVSSPGRYVVESANTCRRVADAQIYDCLRSLRPNDHYVHITFTHTKNWPQCFVSYLLNGSSSSDWMTLPMESSASLPKAWLAVIDAPLGLKCTFRSGPLCCLAETFDHSIQLPGRYNVDGGSILYVGPSPEDLNESL